MKKFLCLLLCLLPTLPFADSPRLHGTATYYASYLEGRKTSSGERYNPDAFTAAHATLPLQTYVQVQHLQNGRSVVVKINDRMSRRSRFVIDLSKKAARQLGIVGAGSGKVKLVKLEKETALALLQENDG